MITKNLLTALEEIGFKYSETDPDSYSYAFAVYGGFLVSAYESGGKKIAYFNFKFSDGEENAQKKYAFSEALSSGMDEYSISDYSLNEDGLTVKCSGNATAYMKMLDYCVKLLLDNEIDGITRCSVCGNKFGSRSRKKVTFGSNSHIMCEHCAIEAVQENKKPVQKDSAPLGKKNLFKGILGSFLFSLIGVFLYFVFYYWLSPAIGNTKFEVRYLFCGLGFLVALFAYVGYRLFCKKVSLSAYIVIPTFSVLFTMIGQYLGVVFEFIAKNHFHISNLSNKAFWLVHLRNTVPADLADQVHSYSGDFYILLTISLLFAVVGCAIFLLSLHEKSVPKKEPLTVETLKIN